jgi:hypothetical protein
MRMGSTTTSKKKKDVKVFGIPIAPSFLTNPLF